MSEVIKKGNKTFQHFETPEAVLAYLEQTPCTSVWKDAAVSEETGYEREEFTQTATRGEAIKLARYGWPEGRKHMTEAAYDIAQLSQARTVPSQQMDVAGQYPIAALAAAGDPMAMVTLAPVEERAGKTVRLLINVMYNHTIKTTQINRWGGAIASVVDQIEGRGDRSEITIVWANRVSGNDYLASVTIKQAEDPLDINQLAFWLAHPSSLRRIEFGLIETHAALFDDYRFGYGSCGEAPKEMRKEFDAYIKSANKGDYSTREKALETVTKGLIEQGVVLDTSEDKAA